MVMVMVRVMVVSMMICCWVGSVSAAGGMGGYAVNDYYYGSTWADLAADSAAGNTETTTSEGAKTVVLHESCCCGCRGTPPPVPSPATDLGSRSEWPYQPLSDSVAIAWLISMVILVGIPVAQYYGPTLLRRDSVLMVQVALDGATDQIQRDLELIADTTYAQTRGHLSSMLSATASCICGYQESCFSAYTMVTIKRWFTEGWEKCFERMYREERRKVNAYFSVKDNGDETRSKIADNKYLIVTILVAASGRHDLPAIKSYADLDMALYSLSCIRPSDIKAVKVLWTSRDDIKDFTSLRCLWKR